MGEASLADRQRNVLLDTSHREVPIAALLFTVIIVVFDALTLLSGSTLTTGYLLSDLAQALVYLAVAFVVSRRLAPPAAGPWLWTLAAVVSAIALNYQFTVTPGGPIFGVLVMLTAVYGPLTLMWRPFVVGVALMVTATSVTMATQVPDDAATWVITYLTAVGGGAALLFARRRSSLDVVRASAALARAATRDDLTGLLNRRGLAESAPVLLGAAERAGRPIYALFIDVGGLKEVNDSYGHGAGDLVLQRTADAARRASRSGDLVVRWGGDEFLLVGVGDKPLAREMEVRLRQELDLDGLEDRWPGVLHVGAAVDEVDDIQELIQRADAQMYRSRADS